MTSALSGDTLPDAAARRRALLDHDATLLVEAGAGSGKTALIAGRIALLLAGGAPAREIVAITFTEAASSELRERIDRFVFDLVGGKHPRPVASCVAYRSFCRTSQGHRSRR
jgi:superfamily I DNA and RNA helicase